MRRLLSVLSAAALMAAMLILVQGTAMARSFNVGNDHFTHHNDFFDNKGFFGGFDQDIDDTGDVNISTRISQRGNNSNQSAAPLQFANTGNFQNAQGFVQVDSTADDVEFEGGSFEFSPSQEVGSNQAVRQSATSRR